MWTKRFEGRRRGHVDVDALNLAALTASAAGPGVPPEVRAHLETCPACAQQVAALEASLAETRREVEREADAVFTERRLARQHSAILRRLDPAAEPGRVLTFPAMSALAHPVRMVARRWVAAAAVVGLVSGLAAGRFLDRHEQGRDFALTARARTDVPATSRTASVRTAAFDAADDEQFLVEVEAALLAPRIEPLRTIDALTPRVGDPTAPTR